MILAPILTHHAIEHHALGKEPEPHKVPFVSSPTLLSQADVRDFDEQLARDDVAGRYAHRMDGDTQWHYDDWLAEQCGPDTPHLPPWRQRMYEITGDARPT